MITARLFKRDFESLSPKQVIIVAMDAKHAINLCASGYVLDEHIRLEFPVSEPIQEQNFIQVNFGDPEFVAAIDDVVTHNVRSVFKAASRLDMKTAINQIMGREGLGVREIGLSAYFGHCSNGDVIPLMPKDPLKYYAPNVGAMAVFRPENAAPEYSRL